MHLLPRRSTLAPLLAAAAAGGLAVAGAGCGGSTGATLDPIAQAAEATAHAGGARTVMSVVIDSPTHGKSIALTGTGIFNMSREEGELSFQLGATRGVPAAKLKKLGGKLALEELVVNNVVYMRSSLFEKELPGGAKWLKLDLSKLEAADGINASSLSSAQSDPTQVLRYLRAVGGGIKDEGPAVLRGVPTTHYAGSVDLNRAAETLPTTDRAKLKASIQRLVGQLGSSSIPIQVWVDREHRVRRMRMEMPTLIGGNSAQTTIDYELYEFGVQPGVTPPPSSEVFDATKLGISQTLGG